jgi:hypothetical protein
VSTCLHCRCLVATINGGRSPSSGFQNCPRPQLLASKSNSSPRLKHSSSQNNCNSSQSQSQSYVTTDGQPASLSWNKAPIWGLRPDLDYCRTVAGLLIWGALSDERTCLSFAIATGPRQRSHFWVRVP